MNRAAARGRAIAIGSLVALAVVVFLGRARVGLPSAAGATTGAGSWDSATSACAHFEPGASVPLFGGAVTCTYAGETATSAEATSRLVGNLLDRACEFTPCVSLSGGCTPDCKKSRDCGDGFCQNAHYVGSRLVMDPGECSLVSARSPDNPAACFTCKCR